MRALRELMIRAAIPVAVWAGPLATGLYAQQGLVRWAYGPFATPGDAAFIVEGGAI